MFQGLRSNSLFYILEKSNGLKLKIGQVVSVSNPAPKYNQYPSVQPFQPQEMYVDVKVKVGEETMEYKQLPAAISIANFANDSIVVSESKEAMSAEVEAILRSSQQALESIKMHEQNVKDCDVILRQLNPVFAKEKQTDERIDALEDAIGGVNERLDALIGLMTKTSNKSSRSNKDED